MKNCPKVSLANVLIISRENRKQSDFKMSTIRLYLRGLQVFFYIFHIDIMEKNVEICFDVLYKGEQRINEIKDQVILIMGQTRAGKSCLCNHIRERRMVGKSDQSSVAHYAPCDNDDATYAVMGDSISSVTLDPNIFHLTESRSLIDAAGFDQNRDMSGVIAVSYFLEALFSKLSKVKFILVFSEGVVYDRNIQGITGTFDDFISLFNFEAMNKEIKDSLLQSVSIVITHSNRSNEEYLKNFQSISDRLSQEKRLRNIRHKDTIVEMMKHVVEGKRINSFKLAEPGVEISKNSLLQDLEKTNWQFFDSKKSRATVEPSQKLIILPFEHDFQVLTPEEQGDFQTALKQRSKTVTSGFAEVIRVFRDSLITNWKQSIKDRKKLGIKFLEKALDNSAFFLSVDAFLSKTYSTYKLKELAEKIDFKTPLSSPKLLEVIFSTLKLVDSFRQVQNNDNVKTIEQKISTFACQIPLMIDEMVCVCSSQEQYQKLKKVTFVMKRAIHEYFTFYKIKKELLNEFNFNLKDNISNSLNRRNIYIEQICNSMDTQLLNQLFTKIPELEIFDNFIEEYIMDLRNNSSEKHNYETNRVKFESNYQMLKMSLATSKFDISIKDPSPLVTIPHLVCLLGETYVTVRKLTELNPSEDSKVKCQLLQMKNIKYVKISASLLIKHDSKNLALVELALGLSELTRCPYETQNIYQQIIKEQQSNTVNLLTFLQKYSKFLIKWGRIEEAIQISLRRKHIYLTTDNLNGIKQTEQAIEGYQQSTASIMEQRNVLLRRLSEPFDGMENNELQKILMNICTRLKQESLTKAVETFKKKRAVPVQKPAEVPKQNPPEPAKPDPAATGAANK